MSDAGARRLDAPAFHRNHGPIGDVLCAHLADVSGSALEIGSGTGQHVVNFAARLPDLSWWPTDPDKSHLRSIEAWREVSGAPNVNPPVFLDAGEEDWALGGRGRPPDCVEAILSLNVVHIAPWFVAEGILRGAGRYLSDTGCLFLYGPFKRHGRHTAESNARFDATLRARDPRWGVRDVADLEFCAEACGLALEKSVHMPANNQILLFRRSTWGLDVRSSP